MLKKLLIFVGVHGVGKTTMAKKIQTNYISCHISNITSPPLRKLLLKCIVPHARKNLYPLIAVTTLIEILLMYVRMLFTDKQEVQMDDEGYTVKKTAILLYPLKHRGIFYDIVLSIMIKSIPQYSVIIYLQNSTDILAKRLFKRNGGKYTISYLNKLSQTYEYLITIIQQRRNDVQVIRLSSDNIQYEQNRVLISKILKHIELRALDLEDPF